MPGRGLLMFIRMAIAWLRARIGLGTFIWPILAALMSALHLAPDGRQFAMLRLVIDLWLRYWLLRLCTALVAALIFVLLLVMMAAYSDVRPGDLLEISGHYAGYTRVEHYEGRLAILLQEYRSPFMIAAHGVETFDESAFLSDVHRGDPLVVGIEKRRQHELDGGTLLVAFAVRSSAVSYLEAVQVATASHEEVNTLPILAIAALFITIISLVAVVRKRAQAVINGQTL